MLTTALIVFLFTSLYAATARTCFLAGRRVERQATSQRIGATLLAEAAEHRASYEQAHDLARLPFTKAEVAAYFRGIRKSAVVAFKMGEVDL